MSKVNDMALNEVKEGLDGMSEPMYSMKHDAYSVSDKAATNFQKLNDVLKVLSHDSVEIANKDAILNMLTEVAESQKDNVGYHSRFEKSWKELQDKTLKSGRWISALIQDLKG